MGSPFPGMDPYLEESSGDIHARLTVYARDTLQPQLPKGLVARIERYDVPWLGRPRWQPEPHLRVRVHAPNDPADVTTVIEFTTSCATRSEDEKDRIARGQIAQAKDASFVWVNLFRDSRDLVLRFLRPRGDWAPSSYWVYVFQRRPAEGPFSPTWLTVRNPLPTVAVPLRPGDPDASLDLQQAIAETYLNGGYDDTDYRPEPVPALDPADAAWADKLLRAAGKR